MNIENKNIERYFVHENATILDTIKVIDEGEEPDDAPDSLAALMREMGFSGLRKQTASKFSSDKIMGW